MSNDLLKYLYAEHETLRKRLDKISELIQLYGGQLSDNSLTFKVKNDDYILNASWKDKIFYALKELDKLSTAKEIADWIVQKEQSTEPTRIHNMVTQYTSSLGISGELGVDNSEFRNKYFVK